VSRMRCSVERWCAAPGPRGSALQYCAPQCPPTGPAGPRPWRDAGGRRASARGFDPVIVAGVVLAHLVEDLLRDQAGILADRRLDPAGGVGILLEEGLGV